MNIKKGDTVLIITGKDKDKKGTVIRVMPKDNKVIVEGLNMVIKHRRPRKSGEKGQIFKIAMPIHISNVRKV